MKQRWTFSKGVSFEWIALDIDNYSIIWIFVLLPSRLFLCCWVGRFSVVESATWKNGITKVMVKSILFLPARTDTSSKTTQVTIIFLFRNNVSAKTHEKKRSLHIMYVYPETTASRKVSAVFASSKTNKARLEIALVTLDLTAVHEPRRSHVRFPLFA